MTDIIIFSMGISGMLGCVVLYRVSVRMERNEHRQRMLVTRATRLLDGERFPPPALTDFEGE